MVDTNPSGRLDSKRAYELWKRKQATMSVATHIPRETALTQAAAQQQTLTVKDATPMGHKAPPRRMRSHATVSVETHKCAADWDAFAMLHAPECLGRIDDDPRSEEEIRDNVQEAERQKREIFAAYRREYTAFLATNPDRGTLAEWQALHKLWMTPAISLTERTVEATRRQRQEEKRKKQDGEVTDAHHFSVVPLKTANGRPASKILQLARQLAISRPDVRLVEVQGTFPWNTSNVRCVLPDGTQFRVPPFPIATEEEVAAYSQKHGGEAAPATFEGPLGRQIQDALLRRAVSAAAPPEHRELVVKAALLVEGRQVITKQPRDEDEEEEEFVPEHDLEAEDPFDEHARLGSTEPREGDPNDVVRRKNLPPVSRYARTIRGMVAPFYVKFDESKDEMVLMPATRECWTGYKGRYWGHTQARILEAFHNTRPTGRITMFDAITGIGSIRDEADARREASFLNGHSMLRNCRQGTSPCDNCELKFRELFGTDDEAPLALVAMTSPIDEAPQEDDEEDRDPFATATYDPDLTRELAVADKATDELESETQLGVAQSLRAGDGSWAVPTDE